MPKDRLAPRVQVNLDELEEDLDNYGEYIHTEGEGAGGPPTPEEFRGDATRGGGPTGVAGEVGEGREAPEAEPLEGEDGAADQEMGDASGGADLLEGWLASGAGTAAEPSREGEPIPGPSGLGPAKGATAQTEAPCSPAPLAKGMSAWNQSHGGP